MFPVALHATACEHLALELTKLRCLLTLRLRQMQRSGLLPPPEELSPGTHIYLQEVEARLQAARQPAAPPQEDDYEALETALNALDDFEKRHEGIELPLVALRRRFGLSKEEVLLLLLAAAPHFDPSFPRLFAFVQNHFERQYPSLALWMELFAADDDPIRYRSLINTHGPLVHHRLLSLHPLRPHLAPIYQPLVVDERVIRFIEGDQRPSTAIAAGVRLTEPDDAPMPLLIPEPERTAWTALLTRTQQHAGRAWDLPWFALRGPEGVGRKRRAQQLAEAMDQPLLIADLSVLPDTNLEESLRLCRREATLQGAALCFEGWSDLLERSPQGDEPNMSIHLKEAQHRRVQRALGAALEGWTGQLFFVLDEREETLPRPPEGGLRVHDAALPDPETAKTLWDRALPVARRAPGMTFDQLALSHRLTPGQIEGVVESALESSGQQTDMATVMNALKASVAHRLGDLAIRIERSYQWDDLILPRDVMVQLQEIISRFRFRGMVLQKWGLGRRFGQDLGLSALFEGPPGTGKTMSASLIAHELGLDLYQIDLSRVVSRYIGETEKNLGRIFDEAERAQAMLLFDEADSLFGARTEIKSSNDRYANLEVNYLLQRIENFSGVAVLTTNFSASIDDAFARRLSARVGFPKPEAKERERLWQSMLSDDRLPKDNLDCGHLAEAFELTGGFIRNAILRAAFIAASRERKLDQETVELAARLEMKEQGMLVQGSPHRELSQGNW